MYFKVVLVLLTIFAFSTFYINTKAEEINNFQATKSCLYKTNNDRDLILYSKLIEKIKSAENIIIFTHINPDGDALGSALALNFFIEDTFNKPSKIVYTGTVPEIYSFLPKFDEIISINDINKDEKFDLALAVDISSPDRLAEAKEIFNKADFRVNIDHHKTNKRYGDLNIVDNNACAAGLILFKIFDETGYKISKNIATALYTAIMTDTGAFKYENTTPECLRTTAALVESGAVPNEIYRACYEAKPLNMFKFQLHILNKTEFFDDGKIAITVIDKNDIEQFHASENYFEGIPEILRTIDTVEVSALLVETQNGNTSISLRSKKTDLIPIVSHFNGGGHSLAAGCTIKKPISDAKYKLLKQIEKTLK